MLSRRHLLAACFKSKSIPLSVVASTTRGAINLAPTTRRGSVANQKGQKKFPTPESTGWGRNTLNENGTGSIHGMEEATFLPHLVFRCLYPVLSEHDKTRSFPLNGTSGNISQIARSIHSNFWKVKVAWKAVFIL